MTAALAPMTVHAGRAPRVSIHVLGEMDDQSLLDMASHGETDRVRVAALLVLIGRQTAADALRATTTTHEECR